MLGMDKDYLRKRMKDKYRMAWKDPGYVNREFNPIKPLRPKVLNEWELARCLMPERSYKYYPDKGHIKIRHQLEDFGYPGTEGLPQKYKKYLDDFQVKFTDYSLRPSKYKGEIKAKVLLEKIELDSQKDPFKLPGTAPGQEFGYSFLQKTNNSLTSSKRAHSLFPQI